MLQVQGANIFVEDENTSKDARVVHVGNWFLRDWLFRDHPGCDLISLHDLFPLATSSTKKRERKNRGNALLFSRRMKIPVKATTQNNCQFALSILY